MVLIIFILLREHLGKLVALFVGGWLLLGCISGAIRGITLLNRHVPLSNQDSFALYCALPGVLILGIVILFNAFGKGGKTIRQPPPGINEDGSYDANALAQMAEANAKMESERHEKWLEEVRQVREENRNRWKTDK